MSATYPEHVKLREISDQSQAIHDFLEWAGEQGLCLAERYCLRPTHPATCHLGGCKMSDRLAPSHRNLRTLLAEFFEIDMDKIEAEKRAMLDAIREANA